MAEIKMIHEPQFSGYEPPKIEEGSLWSEIGGIDLYPDRRARKVGDIVTVRIVEDPEAELNANTKTARMSSIDAKLKFLGYMKALAEKNPRLAQNPGEDDLIKAGLGMSFPRTRKNSLFGYRKPLPVFWTIPTFISDDLSISWKRWERWKIPSSF